jgi:hypothetical protein
MLPPEALAALDGLPPKEALRKPLIPGDTTGRRAARLLAGGAIGTETLTVGEALFRWARVEPEALADANVTEFHRMSDVLGAAGQLPKRLGLSEDIRRSAASVVMASTYDFDGNQIVGLARSYLLQRVVTYLFDAQGCEASICGDEDGSAFFLNGVLSAVHDPRDKPPTRFDRLTFMAQDIFDKVGNAVQHPLACVLSGIDAGGLDGLVPTSDGLGEIWEACVYAKSAAQAAHMWLNKDRDSFLKASSLASSAAASHLGNIVAGKVAAVALVGLAGPWLIVLAPAAGLAGRAAAKNLVRRARYHLLCRHEIIALENAVRRHCAASRDAVETNITAAKAQADKFRGLHSASSGPVQDCISDWLERVQHIQDFRRLQADRLHRASNDPAVLHTNGGDPIVVAQESLLTCARVGLHPANVATTAQDVVAASKALVKRMETLSI